MSSSTIFFPLPINLPTMLSFSLNVNNVYGLNITLRIRFLGGVSPANTYLIILFNIVCLIKKVTNPFSLLAINLNTDLMSSSSDTSSPSMPS